MPSFAFRITFMHFGKWRFTKSEVELGVFAHRHHETSSIRWNFTVAFWAFQQSNSFRKRVNLAWVSSFETEIPKHSCPWFTLPFSSLTSITCLFIPPIPSVLHFHSACKAYVGQICFPSVQAHILVDSLTSTSDILFDCHKGGSFPFAIINCVVAIFSHCAHICKYFFWIQW